MPARPTLPQFVIGVIKRSPLLSQFLFRAFNHVLRRIRPEYSARAYFGATFRCNLDEMIQRTIFYFGFWEPNNSALVGSILKAGDIFVDVGANVGYYSLLASSIVGPRGKVVSIEASPAIFSQLSKNVTANGAANIRLLNLAVAEARGELPLYGGTKWNRGATSTLARRLGQEPEAKVAAAPLDEILTPDEMRRVAMIKIDIEGGELPVLRRMLNTLDLYPAELMILVEMSPTIGADELHSVFDGFLAAGFAAFGIENEYDVEWYLGWRRPSAPHPVTVLPERQQDILLVRGRTFSLIPNLRAPRRDERLAPADRYRAAGAQSELRRRA